MDIATDAEGPGEDHIESWIGRKLEKYSPGVHWHTLLSDGLLTRHGVKLAGLPVEAAASGNGSLQPVEVFWKARRVEAKR